MRPLTKTPLDSSYEVKQFKPEKLEVYNSRSVRASVKGATARQVEILLNEIQKDYRVYIRVNQEDIFFDFDFDGALIEELTRFALIYNLQIRRTDGALFVYDNDSRSSEIVALPFNLSSTDQNALNQMFNDLRFVNFRNKTLVSGPLYRIIDFYNVVPRRDDDQYLMTVVLLNVENDKIFDLAARLNFSSVDLFSEGLTLYDVFESYGDVDLAFDVKRQYFEQQIYLTLGEKAAYNFGNEVQRENRAISDQGTSTISGYQSFKDGVEIETTVNREGDALLVDLSFDRSKFNDASTLSRSQNKITYERLKIRPNCLYYLTQFTEQSNDKGASLLRWFDNGSNRSVMVWFAVFPVTEKSSALDSVEVVDK